MDTLFVKVDAESINASDADLKTAGEIIKNGGLVAFPTETVYGLGASALDSDASRKIYEAKGRPSDNPLIIHIANPDDIEKWCEVENRAALDIIKTNFMPGPITVVQKKKTIIPDTVTAGMDTVAVRCPSNLTARRFIEFAGVPIAAPSANISGRPSPTRAEHVVEDMTGRINMIIDGGECEVGLESTIVLLHEDSVTLLRPGGVTYEQLTDKLGDVKIDKAVLEKLADGEKPLAPGMKYRHYAPHAEVIALKGEDTAVKAFLQKAFEDTSVGIICYREDGIAESRRAKILGSRDNKSEMAHRLFDCLRAFDSVEDVKRIYTRLPDTDELGLALVNRLIKACGYSIKEL